jgi:hypothetical protein
MSCRRSRPAMQPFLLASAIALGAWAMAGCGGGGDTSNGESACGQGTCPAASKCCTYCSGTFVECVHPDDPCPSPPFTCPDAGHTSHDAGDDTDAGNGTDAGDTSHDAGDDTDAGDTEPCGVGTCPSGAKCCAHCDGDWFTCEDPEDPCPTPPIVCPS